jgi:hypothetical protein
LAAIEVEEVERLDRSPAGKLQIVVADPRER